MARKKTLLKRKNRVLRDIFWLGVSVVVAILLQKSGLIQQFLSATQGLRYIGIFIAGFLFTSAFTTPPAIVALAELSKSGPVLPVMLVGAAGAVVGDMIIFHFVRDNLSKDAEYVLQKIDEGHHWRSIFHLRPLRWLMPVIGAMIISSPLPDELGLMLMGISKMQTLIFVPLTYTANTVGIFLIGLAAHL